MPPDPPTRKGATDQASHVEPADVEPVGVRRLGPRLDRVRVGCRRRRAGFTLGDESDEECSASLERNTLHEAGVHLKRSCRRPGLRFVMHQHAVLLLRELHRAFRCQNRPTRLPENVCT